MPPAADPDAAGEVTDGNLPERRKTASILQHQQAAFVAQVKVVKWLIGIACVLIAAGWATSQYFNTYAKADIVATRLKAQDARIDKHDERMNEIKIDIAGIKTELVDTHEHVKDLNKNLQQMNQNLLDVGRGYKPNRILTPLAEHSNQEKR